MFIAPQAHPFPYPIVCVCLDNLTRVHVSSYHLFAVSCQVCIFNTYLSFKLQTCAPTSLLKLCPKGKTNPARPTMNPSYFLSKRCPFSMFLNRPCEDPIQTSVLQLPTWRLVWKRQGADAAGSVQGWVCPWRIITSHELYCSHQSLSSPRLNADSGEINCRVTGEWQVHIA